LRVLNVAQPESLKLASSGRKMSGSNDIGARTATGGFVVTLFPGIRFSPDVAHLAVALLNKGMTREDVKDVLEKCVASR